MRSGANLPVVSSYNRGVVLDAVRSRGPVSRVEIAEMTGLTAPTVSGIVRRLMEEGLVIESGRAPSTGGKPRTLLRMNPVGRYAVGVQIDAESTTYVVVDLVGTEVARSGRTRRGPASPETIIAEVARDVPALLESAGVERSLVAGVGVASPGPIDYDAGVVLHPPNLPRWGKVALRSRLAELLGFPVIVDNDASAAAVGEQWAGLGGSARSFVAVYMGAGIGAGLVINGEPYRGRTSNAGEIGHMSMDVDGEPCHCGNRGCLEAYSSPRAIVAAAREHWRDESGEPRLGQRATSVQAAFATVATAALDGDGYAEMLVQRSARYLAAAVVDLVNLLDLELVVLCGQGFSGLEELYTSVIEEAVGSRPLARAQQSVAVTVSPIASDGAAVGAASLMLHEQFAPQLRELNDRGGPVAKVTAGGNDG